jgi:hypothetical protein
VAEFDQNHRAMNAVVEDALDSSTADPGEPGVFCVSIDFVHLYASVSVVHVADV